MDLIEREPQTKRLHGAWRQVQDGQGRVVLVSGEAGIGKTSLVERFIGDLAPGTPVLRGACDDLFSPQPLGAFLQLAARIRSGRPSPHPPTSDRLGFAAELLDYLQHLSTPAALVLEDLHWADEATLDTVKYLGRRIQQTRTLFIATYRDDEVNRQHPLWFILGDLPAALTDRIALPRLSADAVARLAHGAGRSIADLYAITAGNPFFVTEVIAAEGSGPPPSVRDAVLARVGRLSEAARSVVDVAALVPGSVDLGLLEAVLHVEPATLDECVERAILHPVRSELAFRHELARQSVADSLPIGKARTLHGRILAALQVREGEPGILPRLVHHAVQAGDEQAIRRYAPAAAQQASAIGAHREAAALYQVVVQGVHDLSSDERADLFERLSIELYLIDRVDPAIEARRQSLEIRQRLDQLEKAGDGLRWLSRLHWAAGQRRDAETRADEAIAALEPLPPGRALAMAMSNKSQLHMLAWDEAPAIAWGNRALALAEQLGDVEIMVHALTNIGSAMALIDFDSALATIQRALAIAHERGLDEHMARCYGNMATSAVMFRQYAVAERWFEEGLAFSQSLDLDLYSVYMMGFRSRLYLETGRCDEAEALATESLRLAQRSTITPLPALTTLGVTKARRGDPDAFGLLDRARSLALPTGELQRIGPLAAARAEHAWLRGDMAAVRAEAAVGYGLATERHNEWDLGQLTYWLWLGGERDLPRKGLARPYALLLAGDWRGAADEWARIGCPHERAQALTFGDEGARLTALDLFESLGAWATAEVLRRELVAQGVRRVPARPEPARPRNPADLTSRERQVLELMARGYSNPDIAERLVISTGTVKAHTSSIYGKLGVSNRVQALDKARELRLL